MVLDDTKVLDDKGVEETTVVLDDKRHMSCWMTKVLTKVLRRHLWCRMTGDTCGAG